MNLPANSILNSARDRKYLLLLIVLTLGLFVPNLILQRPALPPPHISDMAYQWHPYMTFFRDCYLKGYFPLWNPYDLCGVPFLAFSNTSSVYPLSFIYLLPFPLATSLSILLHLLLAGIFTYLLFRGLEKSPEVAFICALSFSMSGDYFHLINHITSLHTFSWIPLLFLSFCLLARELKLKWALVMLASFFLCFLGGDSELLFYLFGLLFWFGLVLPKKNSLRFWTVILIFFGLGAFLVSIQFLPLWELFINSIRGKLELTARFPGTTSGIFVLIGYIIFSLLFCLPPPPSPATPLTGTYPFYYGALIFIALLFALSQKERFAWKMGGFLILILVYHFFNFSSVFSDISSQIPFFNKLLNAGKTLGAINFCILLIAGQGLELMLQKKEKLVRAGKYLLPVYGLIMLGISLAFQHSLFARSVLFLLCVAFPFFSARVKLRYWLVLFALLDIYSLAQTYFPRTSYNHYQLHPALVNYLSKSELRGRYQVFTPLPFNETQLPFSAGMLIKAEALDSWMRAPIWSYAKFISLVFPEVIPEEKEKVIFYHAVKYRDISQLKWSSLDYLELVNLRWIVSRYPIPQLEKENRFKLIYWEENFYLYQSNFFMPRAKIFYQTILTRSLNQAFLMLKEKKFDLGKQLLLSSPRAPRVFWSSPAPIPERITLFRSAPDQLLVRFWSPRTGYLFISENYFPGWKAELDGKPTRIWRADYSFQAVFVERGSHLLKLSFQPVSFLVGLWTSLASLVNLVLLVGIILFRKRFEKERHP